MSTSPSSNMRSSLFKFLATLYVCFRICLSSETVSYHEHHHDMPKALIETRTLDDSQSPPGPAASPRGSSLQRRGRKTFGSRKSTWKRLDLPSNPPMVESPRLRNEVVDWQEAAEHRKIKAAISRSEHRSQGTPARGPLPNIQGVT